MKNEIILFENQNVKLEVNMKDETVWLSLEQMSELFGRDKSVISRHIKNAFEEEVDKSTVAKFATVQKEGTRNGIQVIDNNTLVALTLLIAESNPKEKNVIVDLVMNFLVV